MRLSYTLTLLMTLLFIGVQLTRREVPPLFIGGPFELPARASTLEKSLYYDWPRPYPLIDEIERRYGREIWESPQRIAPAYLEPLLLTPVWRGFLPGWLGGERSEANWFESISQGELWRAFTPSLLHVELFHLVFNLFWLLALGRLVEERSGSLRYLLLILMVGLFSNSAQYLMTGMRFFGFSGVVTGLFGYAYSQERRGVSYPFSPSLFKSFFTLLLIIAGVDSLSLFLPFPWTLGIANTAHLSGLALGLLLGRFGSLKSSKSFLKASQHPFF